MPLQYWFSPSRPAPLSEVLHETFCRSSYSEEFHDATGFGWGVNENPPMDMKTLLQKKVTLFVRRAEGKQISVAWLG